MSIREGASAPLSDIVATLQQAPVNPMPKAEDWRQMIARASVEGHIAEVSEEFYWYFLEVLPPKYMDCHCFCFAEGAEPLRVFWRRGDRYFVRYLTWGETEAFCHSAHMPLDYWAY